MAAKGVFGSTVLILFLAMALVSGCTTQSEAGMLPAVVSAEEAMGPATPEPSAEGEGVTPGASAREDAVVSEDDDSVVTSEGESFPAAQEGGRGVQRAVPGQDVPSAVTSSEEEGVEWQDYQNDEFGFEIRYPSVYVILPAAESVGPLAPQPLAEILFQDQDLAKGEAAEVELPQFVVRVFDIGAQQSLGAWLAANDMVTTEAGWKTEPFSLAGVSGVQVFTEHMIAPGRFIYLTKGGHGFELTPLGEYAEQMLNSFRFTQ